MPPSAPAEPVKRDAMGMFAAIEFRHPLILAALVALAGPVVAAAGNAAAAAPHSVSAAAPAAADCKDEEQTPAHTPWWLLLLRLLAAALLIVALADPLLGRAPKLAGQRPTGAGGGQWLDRRQELGPAPGPDRRSAACSAATVRSPSCPPPTPRPGTLLDAGEAAQHRAGIEAHVLARRPRRGGDGAGARCSLAGAPAALLAERRDWKTGKARSCATPCGRWAACSIFAPGTRGAGPAAAAARRHRLRRSPPFAPAPMRPRKIRGRRHRRAGRDPERRAARISSRGETRGHGHIALPLEVRNADGAAGNRGRGQRRRGAAAGHAAASQRRVGMVSAAATRKRTAASVRRLLSGAGADAFAEVGKGHHQRS